MPATVVHYARRRPELTTLYEVGRDNLATLYAASDAGFTSPLPGFVRSELEAYLECGLLCRGFAVMACTEPECHARHLVAFSCKGRGFTAPAALPALRGRGPSDHRAPSRSLRQAHRGARKFTSAPGPGPR